MAALLKKKRFWGAVIAVVLLAYSFKDVRVDHLQDLWSKMNPVFLIPVLALSALMQLARSNRWRTILEPSKRLTFQRAALLYATAASINYIMPALTGQVGRMLLISKKENLPKTQVFSTFLLEIVFDAMMLLTFIFLSSFWLVFPSKYSSYSYLVLGAALVLVALMYSHIIFHKQFDRFIKKTCRSRWPGVYITLKRFSVSFSRGVNALKSTKHLFRSVLMSILIWSTQAGMIILLFHAFGLSLSPATALVVVIVNTLGLLFPITPGNAGTFELLVVATLTSFGTLKTDAALFALALHIIDVTPILMLAGWFVRSEHVTPDEFTPADGEIESVITSVTEDPTWAVEAKNK